VKIVFVVKRLRIEKARGPFCLAYTSSSKNFFMFKYIQKNGDWRAYILNPIDYKDRNSARSVTHRHFDSSLKLYYVCWTAPVKRLDDMVAISKKWAEATVEYIRTEKKF